jgi:hypothetical protein
MLLLPNQDVEATRIDWLIIKYKQYILLREHLLRDVPSLRQAGGGSASAVPARSSNGVMGSPTSREAASRMQLAMDYRQKAMMRQQQTSSPAAAPEAAKDEADEGRDVAERLRNIVSNSSASGTNQRASSALQVSRRRDQSHADFPSSSSSSVIPLGVDLGRFADVPLSLKGLLFACFDRRPWPTARTR